MKYGHKGPGYSVADCGVLPCHSGIKITKLPNKSDCSCLRRSIADEMESLAVVIPRSLEIEEFKNRNSLIPVKAVSKAMLPSVPDAKSGKNYRDLPNISQSRNQRRENDEHSYLYPCLLELYGNTVIEVDSS